MWMSNIFIVVDRNNADRNTIGDITAAVNELGQVFSTDEHTYMIEAAVPSHELPTVSAMEGVCYVRNVFSYFCGRLPEAA